MRLFLFTIAMSALAATVKDDNTLLRSSCYEDSGTVATLLKGTQVTIRYALAGETVPCYKVNVEANGKVLDGYLSASVMEDLGGFDKARRSASWLDLSQIMGTLKSATQSSLASSASGTIAQKASAFIEASQPGRALEILEPEIKQRKDAGLLTLAGVAAWRADDTAKALEYWDQSLAISPNPELEAFYKRVERERNGDKSGEKLLGMRVQLRYEGVSIPPETARQMLTVLDEEFGRVAVQLGCSPQERLVAVAQSPQAYRETTNAAEWSGGQFDGKIRVPVFEGRSVDANMRRTLAHEISHACMTLLGRWPSWLQEGVAQYVSGDRLSGPVREQLKGLAAQGKLPKLDELGQNWSRMNSQQATLAYAEALLAVEVFERDYAGLGLQNLFRNGDRLAQITADLDQRLAH
jgi:hypothetical protein